MMASQGEREPGVVDMCNSVLDSMVQDGDPEQDIGVQEQFPPQTDPEPEMGAATAAVYDTSPPPLRQNPPILAEWAQPSAPDMDQLFAILAGISGDMQGMKSEMNEKNGYKCETDAKTGMSGTSIFTSKMPMIPNFRLLNFLLTNMTDIVFNFFSFINSHKHRIPFQ